MKFFFKSLILFFTISSFSQLEKVNQQKLIKAEEFILNREVDSASFYLNQLEENTYTKLLRKLNNKALVSYKEYDEFLSVVSNKQSIKYIKISNYINEFVKTPTSIKKIDTDYVDIKWSQVNKLRDEVTLEAASKEQRVLENYVNNFNNSDINVLKSKLKITTHPIVMYNIKQEMKGKELCVESLKQARELEDVELEVAFLYYLADFLVLERKLKDYIDVSEKGLELSRSLPNNSYYYSIASHLVDAYLFKGGHDERVKEILKELYDSPSSRIHSYQYYANFVSKLDENSPQKKEILNQFKVKNTLELIEKFLKLGKDLNQHDYLKLLNYASSALAKNGYYNKAIYYKNDQIALTKDIYSKDLSETLATYKSEQSLKEKEKEIKIEKEKTKTYILIAIIISVFLLISLFILRKLKIQSKELSKKNVLVNKTLKEKELLVREVHHRVKNNFQIVSSLLELQSKGIEDERALELANEGKTRVKSMALIHQKLYQDKSGLVDFDEYIKLLVKELTSLYGSENKVATNISSKKMKFDVDTAIPLGLIINEIITNSYKYAFNKSKENQLSISIAKNSDHEYKLIIEDNGPGIPDNLDIQKAKSLGLRLINRLVKQLHGKLQVTNKNGARFEILFKDIYARQLIN